MSHIPIKRPPAKLYATITSPGYFGMEAGVAAVIAPLHNIEENEVVPTSRFDVYETYARILNNEDVPMPLAAVLALTELVGHSNASTMQQLLESLQKGAAVLKSRSSTPLSLTAGCDLFIRYVTSLPQDATPRRSFEEHKSELVRQGRKYAQTTAATCRDIIAQHALGVIKDDSIILTHSYSRVVMHALLHAHRQRRISVYVTEARPRGLGYA
ncbi:translation initiation factor eIF-2B subunit alpha [Ceratobasidium sp. 428]|nr:translation initiation factor eIF-2B subunit alpha [Ceratobasidium sp. 428]